MTFVTHTHHSAAKVWFNSVAPDGCAFCRLTQQGFLRLATNPKVFGPQTVTLASAWKMYDEYLNDPRVTFAAEPAGLEGHWRSYTDRSTFSPKLWNDAYLAAFARAADCELVTFDQGLSQFKDLKCTILT